MVIRSTDICRCITVDSWNQHCLPPDPHWMHYRCHACFSLLSVMLIARAETFAFHGGVMFASYFVLALSDFIRSRRSTSPVEISGVRQQFKWGSVFAPSGNGYLNWKPRFSLIPLTIFYSSLTKLFLLFLLTIWRPSASKPGGSPYYWDPSYYSSSLVTRALEIWDEDKLDREWVVRNVLGGMATGFGLRGLFLPIFSTIRIYWTIPLQLCSTVILSLRQWWSLLGGWRRQLLRDFSRIGWVETSIVETNGWRIVFRSLP